MPEPGFPRIPRFPRTASTIARWHVGGLWEILLTRAMFSLGRGVRGIRDKREKGCLTAYSAFTAYCSGSAKR